MSSLALPLPGSALSSSKDIKNVRADRKPWLYRLPQALQPKFGTTYAETYGGVKGKGKVGILQAVLYGLPEPDKRTRKGVILREGGVLWKVFYGDKDGDKDGTTKEHERKAGC